MKLSRRTFVALGIVNPYLVRTCFALPYAAPPRHQIEGVPFISFEESIQTIPQISPLHHPSRAAALGMVLRYWGKSTDLFKKKDTWEDWANVTSGKARSLNDIKPYLARGIPVFIDQTMTPTASFVSANVEFVVDAVSGGKILREIEKTNLSTGIPGRMASHQGFQKMAGTAPKVPGKPEGWNWAINMAASLASRVVIGYDDERKVVTLHDPTFGPAWEMGYDDFEAAWNPIDPNFQVLEPKDAATPPQSAGPYRPRTANERAAQFYLYGYAHSATGQAAPALEQFKQGLALPRISPGYEHLFRLEIASLLHAQKQWEESIQEAERARDIAPNSPLGWAVLQHIYRDRKEDGDDEREADAKKHLETLRSKASLKALKQLLPREFFIPLVAGIRD